MKRKKTGGRMRGTPNQATQEAKEAAAALVDDPEYRRGLQRRLRQGKLAPAVECLLWYYAKGKPKESLDIDLTNTAVLTDEQLKARTLALLARLEEQTPDA